MTARVDTQSWQRPGRAKRWGYVITGPGELYVSAYRYHSEATARRAGLEDVAQLEALRLAEQEVEG